MSATTSATIAEPVSAAPPSSSKRAGLEGVVAAATALSRVEGEAGRLTLVGYAAEDLAPQATFEEVVHLFWRGRLPDAAELAALQGELAARRALPAATLELLRAAARSVPAPSVMDALRMAAATLSLASSGEPEDDALTLVATFPTVVGSYWRLLQGEEPVVPRPELSHAASYLHQLFGVTPEPAAVRGLETYLNTVSDHGLNASTFAARVIVSTRSDLVSAITGAIGALKGPLHGGAPGPALDLVFEIGSAERAEPVLRAKLARGERLMGFGHRVYRVRDPRADILAAEAERFFRGGRNEENAALYRLAREVEGVALRLLAERKPDRRLDTNVEFYTALLLHGLGLPTPLFTPTFAVGRVVGWTAHALEQLREGRLIRPESEYVGPTGRTFLALPRRAPSDAKPCPV
jgi:citrate synthase